MMRFFTAWIYLLALTLAPAFADSSLMLVGAGKQTNLPPASLTYCGNVVSTGNGTTKTYTAVPFCTASADRYLIAAVSVNTNSGATISSVTIGGVSATQIIFVGTSGSGVGTALYGALVPTGTSGNVVVTTSTTQFDGVGTIYALKNYLSSTPIDTKSSATTPGTFSLANSNGGVALGFSNIVFTAGAGTITWAGLTTDYGATYTASRASSGASASTNGTSINVTATYTGTISTSTILGASFR